MQTKHILPLTGIRAFAACWVVLYHFHPWLVMLCPAARVLDPLILHGYEAVPLFFLLSGFILSHNYFPTYSLTQHHKFLFLRFARLWPVHLSVLMLLFIGIDFPQNLFNSLKPLSIDLSMTGAWHNTGGGYNPPAWSISAEWFAYMTVFPLAFLLFKRIRRWWLVVLIVVGLLAIHVTPANSYLFPIGRCGTIFFLFLAGSGLYQLRLLLKDPPAEAITVYGLLLMIVYIAFSKCTSTFILYAAFAHLIFGLSYQRGFLAKFLSTRVMVYGGLISYSLYMTHYLVIRAFIFYSWEHWKRLPHLPLLAIPVLLLSLAIFLGLAMVFYHFIEEPANRKLRQCLQVGNHRPRLAVPA